MTRLRGRLLAGALAVGAALAGSVPTSAQVPVAPPVQSCDNPNESISLFAERRGPNRIAFGRSPKKTTIPGPTIEMTEGDCLAINLVNDTNVSISLHPHGVAYSPASDGTPHNRGCVAPGKSKTYVWNALLPSADSDGNVVPGSAGYWPYHDHCYGTTHGTLGVEQGLFGAIIVRRAGDPVPDRPAFVVAMAPGSTINLKKAPHTPIFRANQGERVEFAVLALGDDFHTFHLHGHRWADNRTGIPSSPTDDVQVIDNKTVGPADSFGFQVVAGQGVGPGAWMYHCHVQGHSDAGMVGIFLVRNADGTLTPQEKSALARWKKQEGGHHSGH